MPWWGHPRPPEHQGSALGALWFLWPPGGDPKAGSAVTSPQGLGPTSWETARTRPSSRWPRPLLQLTSGEPGVAPRGTGPEQPPHGAPRPSG